MATLLVYPPITDPTSGYHSLCYLETYARTQGFNDIDIVDANIEAIRHCLEPSALKGLADYIDSRARSLGRKPYLDPLEQAEFYRLWRAQSFDYDVLPNAVAVMRDATRFYDYSQYRTAADALLAWLRTLSVLGYPGQFDRGFDIPISWYFNLNSTRDMTDPDILDQISRPFESYYEKDLIPRVIRGSYRAVGINITYVAQLPFALSLARRIRMALPEAVVIFGGTEVSDVWKYVSDKRLFFRVFDIADACVVGEGESAFVSLLSDIANDRPLQSVPNVFLHPNRRIPARKTDATAPLIDPPTIAYEATKTLPTPEYSKLPWNQYLSPHPFVYYSPSRGCYWNKCTFCDYGLNFGSPTSPWRQDPVEKMLHDITEISRSFHHIYFSVDVLAPATLLQVAERIVETGIEIRWGAEIRLEKYWTPERCHLLYESGARAISVGFESGNQRILDCINKGVRINNVPAILQSFHEAGIGVQMMGFTGFPTETLDEAMDSVRFLEHNRKYWTFGGLGKFTLTPGAQVALHPERFGIHSLHARVGDDIVSHLQYEDPIGHGHADPELDKRKAQLSAGAFGRPWLGGIDTPHTLFYHDRYGTKILDQLAAPSTGGASQTDISWRLNGVILTDTENYRVEELQRSPKEAENRVEARLVWSEARRSYFVRADGLVYPFPPGMIEFLKHFVSSATFESRLRNRPANEHETELRLWRHSVAHRFLVPDTHPGPLYQGRR